MGITELWEKYSEALKTFIVSRVKNEEVAKDLHQEVFLRAYLRMEDLKNEGAVRAWLFSIARNLIMDHFRISAKVSSAPVPEEGSFKFKSDHSAEDCLFPLIEELPDKYRHVMELVALEGKTSQEISRTLNISVSGAKSRVQRGRKLLQKGFMGCCGFKLNDKGFLVGEVKPAAECRVCQ